MYRDFPRGKDRYRKNIHYGQHLIAIISVCEWDGVRPTHCSVDPIGVYPFHPKQSTKMLHDKRESHGNDVISPNKTVILQLSNPSVGSRAGSTKMLFGASLAQ